jgi:hypothetical protein
MVGPRHQPSRAAAAGCAADVRAQSGRLAVGGLWHVWCGRGPVAGVPAGGRARLGGPGAGSGLRRLPAAACAGSRTPICSLRVPAAGAVLARRGASLGLPRPAITGCDQHRSNGWRGPCCGNLTASLGPGHLSLLALPCVTVHACPAPGVRAVWHWPSAVMSSSPGSAAIDSVLRSTRQEAVSPRRFRSTACQESLHVRRSRRCRSRAPVPHRRGQRMPAVLPQPQSWCRCRAASAGRAALANPPGRRVPAAALRPPRASAYPPARGVT